MSGPPVTPEPPPPGIPVRSAPEPPLPGRVSATTLYVLHKCDRRLWLAAHEPDLAAPATDFDRLLRERGIQHERATRDDRFPDALGPVHVHGQPVERSAAETLRLLREGAKTLYQPLFLSRDGSCAGVPDFVYRKDGVIAVHDAKLATNLAEHPEIDLQMALYARLVEENLGTRPCLEITDGNGKVVPIGDPGDEALAHAVSRAAELLGEGPEPGTLMTHSVCEACPFCDHCWSLAVAQDRIEVLRDVTRSVAVSLHGLGIHTIAALAAATPPRIRVKGIRDSAESILAEARAHRDGRAVWLEAPRLPPHPIVWVDLEGDPEGEEVDRSIYLWGLAVDDGQNEPRAEAITADFEDAGGQRAWERFVARAAEILDRYPDARWVHYSPYEKTWVRKYAARFGAPDGLEARLEEAFFDLLLRGVRRCVRLPLFSYSIKEVAAFAGFAWRNPNSGSLWSVVRYQKARASGDPAERARILREIEEYNADDLMAMRAVSRWMLEKGPKGHCG